MALGGEWRKEQVNGIVGATSSSGWVYGNYTPNRGEINVKEGFVEVALPLFDGLNINAAGRYTDYSTSGSVKTWKVCATYSPISDVNFRGTYSHDIRAPNLSELFLTGSVGSLTVLMPPNAPTPGQVFIQAQSRGNPNVKPEIANTWTAGIVVTPSFLPGFSASFDYFDIKVKGAIGTVSYQQTVDFCYSGFSQFCDNIVFAAGQLPSILQQPTNFARQHAKGFDIEASYRTPLSAISPNLPGVFRIHAAATHYIKNVIDNLVFPIDYSGVIAYGAGAFGAAPSWMCRVSAFYETDAVNINLTAHGFNSGVYSNEWIKCTTNCPTSTVQRRTINNNRIDSALYFDGSISFKIRPTGNETTLSLIVNNIMNKEPTLVGIDRGADLFAYPQTARPLFDTVGRTFRVALTTKF